MESKIRHYIQQQNLLIPGESVLVGLSGGADSIALTIVLKNLGYKVSAAHCNFHLRGEESDRDECFVRQFCLDNEINLSVTHFDTKNYANKMKISLEMAARELRYNYFRDVMKSTKIAHLAIAHHQNDQVETVLLNLIRGTGIHGIRGMLPKNGDVIRPLLCVTREEILYYLKENNYSFVDDSTNFSTDFTRNKIRLELVPYLKKLNPSIISGINNTASVLSEVEEIYNDKIQDLQKELILTKDYVLGQTPLLIKRTRESVKSVKMKSFWHEILLPYGFNNSQIQSLVDLGVTICGREFYSAKWILYIDRETITLKEKHAIVESSTTISNTDRYILFNEVKIQIDTFLIKYYPVLEKESYIGLFDADKVEFPLLLRFVQMGDYFKPFGMNGKKLVSDFLTNLKIPIWEKKEQLVLCSANGDIIWVLGRRISANYAISDQTQRILRLELC